ncbi:hypothetical protein HHL17_18620 [Chitinophaga sp. G-6-1-13]|uniref:Uncharacterized protein n=1 Tax=Chitinophaga fulva TaxID=2728842 RepID=A0A848GRF4_9BACT|nr:hypothetical protein [Chitinophaga fulva]NML39220.1 hypothetical protein [Chitinophaga fulva]
MLITTIPIEEFKWVTGKFGDPLGGEFLESYHLRIHHIYLDRIVFHTGFNLDEIFELTLNGDQLAVYKKWVGDSQAGNNQERSTNILLPEDIVELSVRWEVLVRELKQQERFENRDNVRDEVAALYELILEEKDARKRISKLKAVVPPEIGPIWKLVEDALTRAGNLGYTMWPTFEHPGVNTIFEKLAPLANSRIRLRPLTSEEFEKCMEQDNFLREQMITLNRQLEHTGLKIVAMGPNVDPYQAFACFPSWMLPQLHRQLEALCLICLY